MKPVHFATSNQDKLQIAQTICKEVDLTVIPVSLVIDEIQGEDPKAIIKDKALRAYEQFGKPIVVSDDSWDIPSLNGFPGAYMKSINCWFKPDDFLRLMNGLDDRRIICHQYLAYTDGHMTKIFSNDISGQIINESRGKDEKSPNKTVIVLDSDNSKTIAEVFEIGTEAVAARYKKRPDVWHNFIEWYKKSTPGQ